MADWFGMARTNYFRVKDEAAFRHWAMSLEIVLFNDEEGRFGFCSDTYDGGFPSIRVSKTAEGEMEDIDLVTELSAHLADGEIAVLMEVGHEKARYVSGQAIALNNEAKQVALSLSDIYAKAAEAFHADVNSISEAIY